MQDKLNNPKTKSAVERALKKGKEETSNNSQKDPQSNLEIQHQSFALSAFAAASNDNLDQFPLRQSFILDSGSDVHVCNNISRATGPIRPALFGERMASGSGWLPIVGYDDIELKTKAPTPQYYQTMKLRDVVFVPSFFTNTVSYRELIKGGID